MKRKHRTYGKHLARSREDRDCTSGELRLRSRTNGTYLYSTTIRKSHRTKGRTGAEVRRGRTSRNVVRGAPGTVRTTDRVVVHGVANTLARLRRIAGRWQTRWDTLRRCNSNSIES